MTPSARYLLSFGLTCAVLTALYAIAFVCQLGAPVAAEYWVPEMKLVKTHLAERIPGRKLVILGGSNALFGLDSSLIERETRLATVNLALHGALPLDYMLAHASALLRPGDVVILSLEAGYYEAVNPSPSWFSSNVMAWEPEYFWHLRLAEQIGFARSASARRVLNGVIARLYEARLRHAHGRLVRTREAVLADAAAVWEGRRYLEGRAAYSLRSMDEHGDIRGAVGSFYTPSGGSLSVPTFTYAPQPWHTLRQFRDDCRNRGIRVFIAWPAVPAELAVPARPYIGQIRAHVAGLGIAVLGEPGDYTMEHRYFFDTLYHLNEEGRALRTARLLTFLKAQL